MTEPICGSWSNPRWNDERRLCTRQAGHEGMHGAIEGGSVWQWDDTTKGATPGRQATT